MKLIDQTILIQGKPSSSVTTENLFLYKILLNFIGSPRECPELSTEFSNTLPPQNYDVNSLKKCSNHIKM